MGYLSRLLCGTGLVLLAGCGGALSAAESAEVWEGLQDTYVARPLDLGFFRDGGLFTAPTTCQGGSAESSALHTHAFSKLADDDSGALTGFIHYQLHACANARLRFDGTLRRGVHGVVRQEVAGATAQRMTDTFYGTLRVAGAARGACAVDVTRRIVDGVVRHEGTLCGHPAADLLNRP